MHPRFSVLVESLDLSFRRLIEMMPCRYRSLPKDMPESGIYLFSEGQRHLYVGRSRFIRKRLGRHCRPSSPHWAATFAFRVARESTGQTTATYKPAGSRGDLVEDPAFGKAFQAAKARIKQMDIRFVEEPDPLRQTLLEIYAAVALETPYNDFDTH